MCIRDRQKEYASATIHLDKKAPAEAQAISNFCQQLYDSCLSGCLPMIPCQGEFHVESGGATPLGGPKVVASAPVGEKRYISGARARLGRQPDKHGSFLARNP